MRLAASSSGIWSGASPAITLCFYSLTYICPFLMSKELVEYVFQKTKKTK